MQKSRLSKSKQSQLIELFVAGVMPQTAAAVAGVQFTTASLYFNKLRQLILLFSTQPGFLTATESDHNLPLNTLPQSSTNLLSFGLHMATQETHVVLNKSESLLCNLPIRGEASLDIFITTSKQIDLSNSVPFSIFPCSLNPNETSQFRERANQFLSQFWQQNKNYIHKLSRMPHAHWYLYLKENEWRHNKAHISSQTQELKQLAERYLSSP
ncbi:hypothetical protein [Snodgrassella sp. CFCC 13594]|uniref:hypothetical protein n=1 Tax=Snodgrassella sp. CFCC 13594 TaxID=1775559 RepID=UPI00082F0313|nr:hypothetical protein [Snodgrassella sp. CFCC 13594]